MSRAVSAPPAPELLALAGRALMAGYPAEGPPEALLRAIAEDALGGVILFRRNLGGALPEIGEALAELAGLAPPARPLLVALDQEGGRVRRLGPPVIELPPARRFGEADDPALTRRAARVLGRQLLALGFNVDFAPVLDVDTNPDNPVIGDRAYGREPERVIRHGRAFLEGLGEAGVIGCGKHFPGHGDTDLDSHLALPRLAHGRARLDAVELRPFAALAAALPMIMSAHVVFEAIEAGLPATLSRAAITELLRAQLGFDGVVVSDDLEMKAVADHYGVEESACRAVEAGCDLLLICSRPEWLFRAREALAARAEADAAFEARLREAAGRVDRLRATLAPVPRFDRSAFEGALEEALDGEEASKVAAEIRTIFGAS